MTAVLSPTPKFQAFDNNGRPLVGGKLFTYIAGTTTKLATYVDSAGITPNANPVILDYRGECNLWVPPNVRYKYVLAPSTDTDPPTHPIWTVDNLVSSQLVTLYGGVDTGVANAYVLTFVANFTAYTDGILIYWLPANTNTGASTLNVNGLGVVPILNLDGSALGANQIVANQMATVISRGGNFYLLSSTVSSGSFTPAWAGFSVAPVGTMYWQLVGDWVSLKWIGGTGTSNATLMSFGNLPANIRPSTLDLIGGGSTIVIDNGAYAAGSFGFGALGTFQFNKGTAPPSGTGFTNPGVKGLANGWSAGYSRR